MNQSTSEDKREALKLVDAMIKAGIDFVPVPVKSPTHKALLMLELSNSLEEIQKACDIPPPPAKPKRPSPTVTIKDGNQ